MKFSAVVPFHNEEDSVRGLWDALRPELEALEGGAEAVLVDDGSTDGTLAGLNALERGPVPVLVVPLGRRSGLASALQAGLDRASGEILITLDGDLQNDPADIRLLVEKLDRGFDFVIGWRRRRRDPFLKKVSSLAANLMQRVFLGVTVHDVGCNLRVMRRAVAEKVRLRSGYHRFAAALAARAGFRVGEVPVLHHARRFGRSRFGFGARTRQGAADFFRVWIGRP